MHAILATSSTELSWQEVPDVAAKPGEVVIELAFREDLTQQHGYLHAAIRERRDVALWRRRLDGQA